MQSGSLTVGETAVLVPVTAPLQLGVRLLGREDNDGLTYLGTTSAVTTTTGILVPQGDPATSYPLTVPPEHYGMSPATIYLIADGADQVVDWSAQ